MNAPASRLRYALETAARIGDRLESSTRRDDHLLAQAIDATTSDEAVLRAVDAFVQRFAQFYEALVRRVLPAIYRIEQLGERPPPLIDLLNWAEGLDLITGSQEWARVAEARNRLIHEYPLDEIERGALFGAVIRHAEMLLDDFALIQTFVADRKLLEGSGE